MPRAGLEHQPHGREPRHTKWVAVNIRRPLAMGLAFKPGLVQQVGQQDAPAAAEAGAVTCAARPLPQSLGNLMKRSHTAKVTKSTERCSLRMRLFANPPTLDR